MKNEVTGNKILESIIKASINKVTRFLVWQFLWLWTKYLNLGFSSCAVRFQLLLPGKNKQPTTKKTLSASHTILQKKCSGIGWWAGTDRLAGRTEACERKENQTEHEPQQNCNLFMMLQAKLFLSRHRWTRAASLGERVCPAIGLLKSEEGTTLSQISKVPKILMC